MVDVALSSMALTVFSRIQHHPPAAKEASSKYHQALQIVQNEISQLDILHLDVQHIDACLLAIYLMGRYEAANCDLSSDLDWKDSPSFRHHDGAMAILGLWNDASSQTPATFIMKQTRRGLIRSSLLRNAQLPTWILDGSRFGESGVELAFDRIYVQTVSLHCTASLLSCTRCIAAELAEELNKKARELDEALQDWMAQLPSAWSPGKLILKDRETSPSSPFYRRTVYNYHSPVHASVWAHGFAARMLINSTRLTILDNAHIGVWGDLSLEKQRFECIDQLATMADNLASTVPFCLERSKDYRNYNSASPPIILDKNTKTKPYLASLVVWPLSIASSLEGIDTKQQAWFRAQLAGLGAVLGGGIFQFAETRWAKL
ncbi:hypothetical protein D0Z07_1941 [Hyphodiscus hymeniophilus]|uniref:Uncharacterized protein n=1 Tax=Hyphodiscus hymeniophilus TaxID=353542 RepID=A0A9P6VMT6_9HELO|nr:hypothetical protein D0Z07_1941 [Hyphodiscus hymeniophilus]